MRQCPGCGYVMSDLDRECPRCRSDGTSAQANGAHTPEVAQPERSDAARIALAVGGVGAVLLVVGSLVAWYSMSVALRQQSKNHLPQGVPPGVREPELSEERGAAKPGTRAAAPKTEGATEPSPQSNAPSAELGSDVSPAPPVPEQPAQPEAATAPGTGASGEDVEGPGSRETAGVPREAPSEIPVEVSPKRLLTSGGDWSPVLHVVNTGDSTLVGVRVVARFMAYHVEDNRETRAYEEACREYDAAVAAGMSPSGVPEPPGYRVSDSAHAERVVLRLRSLEPGVFQNFEVRLWPWPAANEVVGVPPGQSLVAYNSYGNAPDMVVPDMVLFSAELDR